MDKNGGNKQNPRIVVIGLDSADFYLIQNWINEGYLPTMASLITRGCWGKLKSTSDISSGTVWPSFYSGTSPAKHQGLGRHRLSLGTYHIIDAPYANLVKREPFWMQLSRAGKRIAIIDAPRTYPIEGLNGIQIVGWGAHAPNWHADSWPPELIKKIVSRFGHYPPPDCDEFIPRARKLNQHSEFCNLLISGIDKKGLVSKHFLDHENWDLFLTVFAEPHCIGHYFWHVMDKNHPAYNTKIDETLGDPIFNVYSKIDSELSKLIDNAGDATYFIVSPEGMGPNYTGSHLLPEILSRLGMASAPIETSSGRILSKRLKNTADSLRKLSPAARWGPYAVRNIRSMLPSALLKTIELISRLVPRQTWDTWKSFLMTVGNDWRSSRAFCIPCDFNGAIRINLKGREPEGLVEPGAEYESLCNELVQELSQLINEDTGKKAVSEVLRVERIHKGDYTDELPDIIVKWVGDSSVNGLSSTRIGTVTGQSNHERSGAHRPYGLLIASGKHIATSSTGTLDGANIMDVAPTILYLMGQPVPRDMDGRILLDLIDDEFKANNPVQYS